MYLYPVGWDAIQRTRTVLSECLLGPLDTPPSAVIVHTACPAAVLILYVSEIVLRSIPAVQRFDSIAKH